MNYFWTRLFLILGAILLQTSWGIFMPVNLVLPVVWLVVGWVFWEMGREKVLLWAFLSGLGLDLVGNGWLGMQALSLSVSWGLFLVLERGFLGRSKISQMFNGLISLGSYYFVLWILESILPTI